MSWPHAAQFFPQLQGVSEIAKTRNQLAIRRTTIGRRRGDRDDGMLGNPEGFESYILRVLGEHRGVQRIGRCEDENPDVHTLLLAAVRGSYTPVTLSPLTMARPPG